MTGPDEARGVVTMLDVLGWKGVYNRREQPLEDLKSLVENLHFTLQLEGNFGMVLPHEKTLIRSISDTIAVFTQVSVGRLQGALEFHGLLCAEAIRLSLLNEIPVRGATSVGEFDVFESMFVGKAIDEAAAWYEQGDWVGVHLTPSAEFAFDATPLTDWVEYQVPLKQGNGRLIPCVDWTVPWDSDGQDRESLKSIFTNMGPITPDISSKFTNTLAFYDAMKELDPKG